MSRGARGLALRAVCRGRGGGAWARLGRMRRAGGGGVREAVFLAAAFYALLIVGFSPSLKKQTFLPAYPCSFSWRSMCCRVALAAWIPAAACLGLFVHQFSEAAPWRDGMATQRELLRAVLRSRGRRTGARRERRDVFRPARLYLVFVQATMRGIEQGRLPGPIWRSWRPRARRWRLAAARFPAALRKFLRNATCPPAMGRCAWRETLSSARARCEREIAGAGDYVWSRGRANSFPRFTHLFGACRCSKRGRGGCCMEARVGGAGYPPAKRD